MSALALPAAILVLASTTCPSLRDAPIIGVLAVPVDHSDCITVSQKALYGEASGATSCFHSLYVKWLEAAGARVVPLPFDLPRPELDVLLRSINGALITGGETDLSDLRSPYMETASYIYQHALGAHADGETWPLWGTCMGMQVLSVLGAADPSVLLHHAYDSEQLQLPLTLAPAAAASALLCKDCLPGDSLDTLTRVNSTVNLHHDGVPPSAFAAGSTLSRAFHVLSTNVDAKGKPFVSTIEATGGAKIFGVQWHPERPQFEFDVAGDTAFMSHSSAIASAMFAVASRLVRFARCNARRFASPAAEASALIYQWKPVGDTSYQAYFFGGRPGERKEHQP